MCLGVRNENSAGDSLHPCLIPDVAVSTLAVAAVTGSGYSSGRAELEPAGLCPHPPLVPPAWQQFLSARLRQRLGSGQV